MAKQLLQSAECRAKDFHKGYLSPGGGSKIHNKVVLETICSRKGIILDLNMSVGSTR